MKVAYEGKRSAGRKKSGKWVLFVCILLVIIVAGLIWFFAARHRGPAKVENTVQEVVAEDDVIKTPYGELRYPGMWTRRVSHEIVEDGTDFRIVFRSTVKDAEAELFTLCYGTVPEGGYVMGSYADGVQVSVVMKTIDPADYAEDALADLYSLQESVNDLLIQLREDPAFTAAQ